MKNGLFCYIEFAKILIEYQHPYGYDFLYFFTNKKTYAIRII